MEITGWMAMLNKLDRVGVEVPILQACLLLAIVILVPLAMVRRTRTSRAVLGIALVGLSSGALLSWDWFRDGVAVIPFLITQITLILFLAGAVAAIFSTLLEP